MLACQFRAANMPQFESGGICLNLQKAISVASQFPPAICRFLLSIRPSVLASLSPSSESRLLIVFEEEIKKSINLSIRYALVKLAQSKETGETSTK